MATIKFAIVNHPVYGVKLLDPKVSGTGDVRNAEIIVTGNDVPAALLDYVRDTVAPQFRSAIPTNDDYSDADYDAWDAAVLAAKKAVRNYR
jgi:hypothetical protein